MILKYVYKVKINLHLYSPNNFLPYLMWDITITSSYKYNVLILFHEAK